jgi:thiamine biosynthesis lipoprotein
MGVDWSARALLPPGLDPERVRQDIQLRLDRLVGQMSPWQAASDISGFNRAEPGEWRVLPADFFAVLDGALALAADTDGAFDPTIGRLVDLWGFGPPGAVAAPPSDTSIDEALAQAGWRGVVLDRAGRRALQPGGVSLDLSGIAKGYGVDEAARRLEALGVTDYLVEIGGELRGAGAKSNGEPWWVEIESPPRTNATAILVALSGLSIATSGDYRRHLEVDGKRLGHTLDPRTGRPVNNGVVAVTVLHPECLWADALCTVLSVLGANAGMAYAARAGLAARILAETDGGLRESLSPAFEALLS